MEKLLVVLIIILLLILIVLLVGVGFLFLKYLRSNNNTPAQKADETLPRYQDKIPDDLKHQINEAKQKRDNLSGQFCADHPENPAKGKCSITDTPFCELCITREKDVRIARKYLHLFLDSKWETLFFLEDDDLQEGDLKKIKAIKKELWNSKNIPIITQKQFKINIETDDIETFTVIMTRPEDKNLISEKMKFLNQ